MQSFIGTGVALVTPFKKDFSVDVEALARIVNHVVEGGVEYLVVLGTTAESATLSQDEKELVIDTIIKANAGRLPLVLGVGGNNTHKVVEELKTRDFSHFSAILSVSPYYNKPTQEGIYQHFKAVAEASPIPVILYNVPGRTSVDLETATTIRLFDDVKNIYSVKEATGSLERSIALLSQRKDFIVVSGDDAIDFPMLVNGAKGIISVTANILPNLKSKLVHDVFAGNLESARKINDELYALNSVLFCESNPLPIKAAMYIAGLLDTLEYRLPLTAPSAESMKKLEKTLIKYEVIK